MLVYRIDWHEQARLAVARSRSTATVDSGSTANDGHGIEMELGEARRQQAVEKRGLLDHDDTDE